MTQGRDEPKQAQPTPPSRTRDFFLGLGVSAIAMVLAYPIGALFVFGFQGDSSFVLVNWVMASLGMLVAVGFIATKRLTTAAGIVIGAGIGLVGMSTGCSGMLEDLGRLLTF